MRDHLGWDADGGGVCWNVLGHNGGHSDDGMISNGNRSHGFSTIAHEDILAEYWALLVAVGKDEADAGIEVAVGADFGIWGDDNIHRMWQEPGANSNIFSDFDFEKPKQDFGCEDAR